MLMEIDFNSTCELEKIVNFPAKASVELSASVPVNALVLTFHLQLDGKNSLNNNFNTPGCWEQEIAPILS